MAKEKNINSRIQHKIDTTENWAKATGFIPKKGEIIVYQDDGKSSLKIGDGETVVIDLPFSQTFIVTTEYDTASDKYYASHNSSDIFAKVLNNYQVLLYH
jgi:hypothetical protein